MNGMVTATPEIGEIADARATEALWDAAFELIWGEKNDPIEFMRVITEGIGSLKAAGASEAEIFSCKPLQALIAQLAFIFGQGPGPGSDAMKTMALREAHSQMPGMTG